MPRSRRWTKCPGPVVSIALILASVFIPVAFMGGIQGSLNKQFAITIADLGAHLGVQRAHAVAGARRDVAAAAEGRDGCSAVSSASFNRGFERATHGYVGVSRGAHPQGRSSGIAILAGFALLARRARPHGCPTSFLPEEDYGYFLLNVQLPPAASLQRTDDVCRKVEAMLAQDRRASAPSTPSSASAC